MVLGMARDIVRLVPYRPEWPSLFEQEKRRILAAIGQHVLDVQHVGSTAIPGMLAKPILDIGIAVESFEEATVCIAPMEALRYRYRGELGIPYRHYFVRGEPRTHQVHMLEREGPEWGRMLLFRDFLRAHVEARRAYADLKQRVATVHSADVERYTKEKGPFIEKIIKEARREIELERD